MSLSLLGPLCLFPAACWEVLQKLSLHHLTSLQDSTGNTGMDPSKRKLYFTPSNCSCTPQACIRWKYHGSEGKMGGNIQTNSSKKKHVLSTANIYRMYLWLAWLDKICPQVIFNCCRTCSSCNLKEPFVTNMRHI